MPCCASARPYMPERMVVGDAAIPTGPLRQAAAFDAQSMSETMGSPSVCSISAWSRWAVLQARTTLQSRLAPKTRPAQYIPYLRQSRRPPILVADEVVDGYREMVDHGILVAGSRAALRGTDENSSMQLKACLRTHAANDGDVPSFHGVSLRSPPGHSTDDVAICGTVLHCQRLKNQG